jgi:type I restriction enzyme S subunit
MSAEKQIPPGYKMTEVGVIPEEWEVKELESFASVTSGKRMPLGKTLTEHETPHPYIRVTDMRQGTVSVDELKYVPVDVFPTIKQYRIYKEDLFISVAGTLGIVGKIPCEIDGANLTENADRISNISCSREFLLHVLLAPGIQGVITAIQTKGAQPKLALIRIRKFLIPLPPTLAEQEAIAAALSDADGLIEALEALIAKKRAIKQGAMQELLTGKRRLPGFDGEWEEKILKDMVQIPVTDGPHSTPTFYENGIPFLSVNNLVDNKINLSDLRYISKAAHDEFSRKCKPQKGDLLLGKAASVGKVAIVDLDFTFNIWSPIALIRLGINYCPKYCFYQFQCEDIIRQIALMTNSSSQGNIGMGDIEKLVFVSPKYEEQSAIATVLSDMDAEIGALEDKLAKARRVKVGMMQELLTGRIRLV